MNIKYIFLIINLLCAHHVCAMIWDIPQELWESKSQKQLRIDKGLVKSIRRGNIPQAIAFLDQGARMDHFDRKTGLQALPLAIKYNRLKVLSELVFRGAPINAIFTQHSGKKHPKVIYHGTPILYAARLLNNEAVECLLFTIAQSITQSAPKTPPKPDVLDQHMTLLNQILTTPVQEYNPHHSSWSTDLPCKLLASCTSLSKRKQESMRVMCNLLSPEAFDHPDAISALKDRIKKFNSEKSVS